MQMFGLASIIVALATVLGASSAALIAQVPVSILQRAQHKMAGSSGWVQARIASSVPQPPVCHGPRWVQ
jgi:hypothetical protein